MLPRLSLCASLLVVVGATAAEEQPATEALAKVDTPAKIETPAEVASPAAKTESGDKALSGMSILGNQEAPKALVIVPWKSSRMGDTLGLSRALDDGRQPVDKDVFMRELTYYEIRSNGGGR